MTVPETAVQGPKGADPVVPPTGRAVHRWWPTAALAAICTVAALLYAWDIGAPGWGNPYYSAAVKSMSQSVTAFFFGSFDAAGVITVDKPPVGMWPQVVSVWIFGYHNWALLLPEVVEGVAAVFLIHRTMRLWTEGLANGSRVTTELVPLAAALALALTPTTVATYRSNNLDPLMVLLLVAAAYCLMRALRRGSTGWLLSSAALIGCGFTTKMLAAWMVVPAFALAFLLAAPGRVRRRLGQLFCAGAVLLVSSFWWPAMVSVWPSPKPWIGGSTDGSAWDLIFGYNGLGRIFGQSTGTATGGADLPGGTEAAQGLAGMGTSVSGGTPGLGRLFNASLGGQISWLLPLCLVALVAAAVLGARALAGGRLRGRGGEPVDERTRVALGGWVLWGGWLVVVGLVLSTSSGIFHPYYVSELAPAVAAVAAAGAALFWRLHQRSPEQLWWLLPLTVAGTAAWALVLTSRATPVAAWVTPTVVVVGALAVVALVTHGLRRHADLRLARTGLALAVVAALLTPAAWSVFTAFDSTVQPFTKLAPAAGPAAATATTASMMGVSGSIVSGDLTPEQRAMMSYVVAESAGRPLTLAIDGGALAASPYLIDSDLTVVGMGGFTGTDPVPSATQLASWVDDGSLRFVLRSGMPSTNPTGQDRTTWIRAHCVPVDPGTWGGAPAATSSGPSPLGAGSDELYDCASGQP